MKPILFNTEMVRAILDGRKTQTRRVIKPQPKIIGASSGGCCPGFKFLDIPGVGPVWDHKPYQPGDVLWVRETWWSDNKNLNEARTFLYKADTPYPEPWSNYFKWKPSIHMPKDAARLFLKVTKIRVERLQDISEEDAKAEGVSPSVCPPFDHMGHKLAFKDLWDSINEKRGYGWYTNPWVWVIEFERCKGEI